MPKPGSHWGIDVTGRDDNRLMGWKAIGNFVGRDARTARRWEIERALPVNRVPGGGSASVWADKDELHAWMTRDAKLDAKPEAESIAPRKSPWRVRASWALAGSALAAIVAIPVITSGRATSAKAAARVTAAPYGADTQANKPIGRQAMH